MARVRDAAVTLICLVILVPPIVLTMAAAGLRPRHWSGIPLSGVDLPLVVHPRYGQTRPPELDSVTDQLVQSPDLGWQAVVPAPDDGVYIEVTRLSTAQLLLLGKHWDGDKVGVVYSPLAPTLSLDETVPAESWWNRTDPPATWLALTIGFPLPLAVALLLTTIVWFDILKRRRHTT